MICYKDMTFCASPNCTGKCGRQLTPEDKAAAEKSGLDISLGEFCTPDEPTWPVNDPPGGESGT